VPNCPLWNRRGLCDTAVMFLRRHRKHAGGETYQYWSLVKTIRTARGPQHPVVARLGKLDRAEVAGARSWQDVDGLVEGRSPAMRLAMRLELHRACLRIHWRRVHALLNNITQRRCQRLARKQKSGSRFQILL